MAQASKSNGLPSYIKKEDADQEQFGASDVEFPQLRIAQSTSDEVKKQKANFIKGLEAGAYFNSITKEIYGEEVSIQPIFFFRETVTYKDEDGPVDYFHYVVCINKNMKDLALWSLKSTAVKIAKRLNSLIKIKEVPAYACNYKLGTIFNEGDDGDWHSPTVNQDGFVEEKQYVAANEMYENFKLSPPKIGYAKTGETSSVGSTVKQIEDKSDLEC